LVCGSLLTILFHKDVTITELFGAWGQLQEFIFGDIIAAGYDVDLL
jgi:hypothetical protein